MANSNKKFGEAFFAEAELVFSYSQSVGTWCRFKSNHVPSNRSKKKTSNKRYV